MLLQFTVQNYRSIKDPVTLDLQATSDTTMAKQAVFTKNKISLLKTVGIYGPNASGKSNILRAFTVFKSMILKSLINSPTGIKLPAERFKLSSDTKNKPSFFEMRFILEGEVFLYGFEISTEKICREWLRQERGKKTLFERHDQDIKSNKNYFKEASSSAKKETGTRVLFLSVLGSKETPLSRKILKFIQNTNYILGTKRGKTFDYSLGQFLRNEKRAAKIKEFMVQADFGISDIQASEKMVLAKEIKNIPDKFKDLLFKEGSQIAERRLQTIHKIYTKTGKQSGTEIFDFFSEESEGTQQMFALSAPVIDTFEEGKVLFIDELDASLHPVLCQYLITIFNSKETNPKNAQLIFTTHDLSVLNKEFLRRDQVYFVKKNRQEETELFSLAETSERKEADFAKRYMEGRYGAIPYHTEFENLKFTRE